MKWRRSPGVLWRTAPGYLVLGTVDGDIVEIAGPGPDIWSRLAAWITEEELAASLAQAYRAEVEVVSPDVRSFLHELHANGYVDRSD